MKRIVVFLLLLSFLTGCVRQEPSVPEPQPPTVQEPAPVPADPEPEPVPEPEPAPVPEPEIPSEEAIPLPELPYPAYCWGDTAVSKDGTVLLQVPDHTLALAFDAVSGKPAGFLSRPSNVSWTDVSDGFYALDGTPVLTDEAMPYFQCFRDLCWYGLPGEYTVRRLSDGALLQDSLKYVFLTDGCLILQPNYWNDRCILLDGSGRTVAELDRSFALQDIFTDQNVTYLVMANTLDGRTALVDSKGAPVLERFFHEITDVSQGCAVVRDGEVYHAIDLETEESVLTRDMTFRLLPNGILAETPSGTMLLDRQGNPLDSRPLDITLPYDWDDDGTPEYILADTVDDPYTTLVLTPDGKELASIPMHVLSVKALSPTTVAYADFTGTESIFEAHLVDLKSGTDTVLSSGQNLYVDPITTTGGQMLLCTTDDNSGLFLNDGTPARDELGRCTYLGGDVFACEGGLRCLDGTWLYRPREPQ